MKQIIANPNYLLAYLLQTKQMYITTLDLDVIRQLIPKLSKLYNSNFIVCVLYKQLNWHFNFGVTMYPKIFMGDVRC